MKAFILTVGSALLFVALAVTFADGMFETSHLWSGEYVAEYTIWPFLMVAFILGVGVVQAYRGAPIEAAPMLLMPVRFFLGLEWLAAGEHKVRESAWMDGGLALVNPDPEVLGFWERVVQIPENGRPPITYGWYRDFITYLIDNDWASIFGKLIALGEFAVGLGLIAGALVTVAAFFGAVMNMNFMLAGSASSNPVLFTFSVILMIGKKASGYAGVGRLFSR